jgi:hypothetical protein
VAAFQAVSFVVAGATRLVFSSCLKRNRKRCGSRGFGHGLSDTCLRIVLIFAIRFLWTRASRDDIRLAYFLSDG